MIFPIKKNDPIAIIFGPNLYNQLSLNAGDQCQRRLNRWRGGNLDRGVVNISVKCPVSHAKGSHTKRNGYEEHELPSQKISSLRQSPSCLLLYPADTWQPQALLLCRQLTQCSISYQWYPFFPSLKYVKEIYVKEIYVIKWSWNVKTFLFIFVVVYCWNKTNISISQTHI